MVPVDSTEAMVATVEQRLLGLSEPGGVDSISLQHWMIRFGVASLRIRPIVGEFGDWMSNVCPPWVDYRALMYGRLIVLDKCPGVRLVGVEETWRRMMAKRVLVVTGAEAKEACGMKHL